MAAVNRYTSHGSGTIDPMLFAEIGENVVFEPGCLAFHAEHIRLGTNVYVGHYAILKGYHQNEMLIGDNVWIGQQCFLHAAGGLIVESGVGIGPGVRILTARHQEVGRGVPISIAPLQFGPVLLRAGCNIGTSAVLLPGVTIGRGAQVGAGAVVTRDVPDFGVALGVPARTVKIRPE